MTRTIHRKVRHYATIALALLLLAFAAAPTVAGEYAALDGVKGLNTVFDFTQGSPATATVVFPAIKEVYTDKNVTALPTPPRTVIVFHGPAVKFISTDRKLFDKEDHPDLDKVAEMIRQFKKDGVKMEVCMYAVKVFGVDPATIMPEIDRVGNGFISVAGYQAQGYSIVAVP
jgi:intracellular sulfur oxidation DsrE/DsrF family protein